jgi:hypothetical protein
VTAMVSQATIPHTAAPTTMADIVATTRENGHASPYDRTVSYQPPSDWMTWDLRSLAESDNPPPSVRKATWFICAGATIEVVALVSNLAAYQSAVSHYQSALSQVYGLQGLSGQLHWAEATGRIFIVVTSLARVGLWLWMASRNYAGRRWARILSTVFFVINSLALLDGIVTPIGGDWRLLFPVSTWLVGVCAIALLWRRESGEFVNARSPRY